MPPTTSFITLAARNKLIRTRVLASLCLLLGLGFCCLLFKWSMPLRRATQQSSSASAPHRLAVQPGNMDKAAAGVMGSAQTTTALPQATVDSATHARLDEAYGKLPLQFEANAGQTAREVKFLSRGNGYTLFLTPTEAVLSLSKPVGPKPTREGDAGLAKERLPAGKLETAARGAGQANAARQHQRAVVRMQLVGGDAGAQVSGMDELPGKVNYFIGNDPQQWRADVSTYKRVQFASVYPGIDMIYYGNQRQLEYDFVVAPHADPRAIRLKFTGAQRVRVDESGELVLKIKGGDEVRQHQPIIYQEVDGRRREVAGHYVLRERMEIGVEVAEYDTTKPLVLDPVLTYSTYLGSSYDDFGNGIAIDSAGNAYVTGETDLFFNASGFPTVNARQPNPGGGFNDAFVTKFNAAGTALIYSTFLGGSSTDVGNAIAVDSAGNAYVTGYTFSSNFPTVNARQSARSGFMDAFVAKLNASGSTLLYSTYHGGSDYEYGYGIAADSAGNAYVTGYTSSTNFPTAGPRQPTNGGGSDAFLTKFNTAGSALIYSTYHGGSSSDLAFGVAVDAAGNAYIAGYTASTNFPTVGPVQPTGGGSVDAFVAKFNAAGSALVYSTYLGGGGDDRSYGIAADAAGNAYVAGATSSNNFPTVNAQQSAFGGIIDAFVTKLNTAGTALVYSTYLGGSGDDKANGIAADSSGNAYIAGVTSSTDFPTANAVQGISAGISNQWC